MCVLVVENVLSAVQFKRPNALVISDQISHKHMAVHRWLGTTSVDKVKKKKKNESVSTSSSPYNSDVLFLW